MCAMSAYIAYKYVYMYVYIYADFLTCVFHTHIYEHLESSCCASGHFHPELWKLLISLSNCKWGFCLISTSIDGLGRNTGYESI